MDNEKKQETKEKYQTVYHYTTKDSAKGIAKSKLIKASRGNSINRDDATYGEGVYLTPLPPTQTKEDIAKNNYGSQNSFYKDQIEQGKLDYCIEVKLKKDDKRLKKITIPDRDIILYHGDLDLNNCTWNTHNIEDEQKRFISKQLKTINFQKNSMNYYGPINERI